MSTRIFSNVFLTLAATLLTLRAAAQDLSQMKVTLRVEHNSLKEVMHMIEQVTSFKFIARAEDVDAVQDLNLEARDQPLDKVLTQLLKGRNIRFRQMGTNIFLQKDNSKKPASSVIIPASYHLPEKYTISGTVRAHKTGESIIGATIRVSSSTNSGFFTATLSNEYGFYSLTLPVGAYHLQVSYVGMSTILRDIDLDSSVVWDIPMEEGTKDLEEVTVRAAAQNSGRSLKSPQMGMERMSISEIKDIPVIFGEKDVLKTIQLLPGIKSAGDGNSGFYVRGGAADQNLILLDEATVYNPSHLLGFFSTFNSDAIKSIVVYKGGMPAQYGGRLSSVVDVRMNEGNNKDFGASGGIGLISSRLTVEGPIQKDRSSFLVSGRRTYVDMFLRLSSDSNIKRSQLYFYDLNAKVNYTLNSKDRLYLSGYFGRDVLGQETLSSIDWGNTTATARWNHVFNSRLFSNTSLIYSNYDFKITNKEAGNEFNIISQIRDWTLKEDIQWYAGSQHTVNIGIDAIHHTIRPGEITANKDASFNSMTFQRRYSLENAAYLTDTWKMTDKLTLTYGLRLSAFSILGKGDYYNIDTSGKILDTLHYGMGQVVKTYFNVEPRLAAAWQLNGTTSIKASYVRNTQNLHLVSNSITSSPTDRWVANTNIIRPEISDQVALGYYKDLAQGRWELTVETYYKTMQHQIDYRDGANIYTNQPIETQLLFGKGRAYGIEWLLKKRVGRLTGWLGYTLSRTERKIDGINNGQWYNARQDRTHDISIVGIYQLNKKWTLSADWVFYTGDAVTFPSGKYTVDGVVYFLYTKRNAYRMPSYHRLDLGATCQLKQHKRFSSELSFSLYNAYGRQNAYQISFRQSKTDPNRTEAVRTSLFTFVPSISYNFKF
jgi:hypothetical protein